MRFGVDPLTSVGSATPVWDPIADAQRFEKLHARMFGTRPDKPQIGRYELGERLGEGGAGFVHRGFDPVLRRAVAIKLVPIPAQLSAVRTDELMAEAHALAALVHPHLVRVHDAGTCTLLDLKLSMSMPAAVSGQRMLYLVMELVEGPLLTRWLEATRSRRETLTAFLAMGEALTAAHAAGIVHRDFKPDNVVFDGEGRPKILDFGLAGPSAAHVVEPSADLVFGTPAYMAPEQHEGQPGGPAVDQFSFCVTLWEALTGDRPYNGPTLAAYRTQKLAVAVSSSGRALPRRLRTILLRGLDPDPRRRWESMADLIAAIRRIRRRHQALWIIGGVAAVATVAVAATLALSNEPVADPCTDDPRGTSDPIWSAPVRDRITTAFDRQVPHAAAELMEVVQRRFAGLQESWMVTYQQACAIENPQRDETVGCLLAAKSASQGVLEALEREPDARAVQVLELLPYPAECLRDVSRAEWEAALSRELLEYRSRMMLGEVEAVLHHAEEVLDSAEELPPDMVAEWLLVSAIGRMSNEPEQARPLFERALKVGERAGNDQIAVRAMLGLSNVLALTDPAQARLYLDLADSRRASLGPRRRVAIDAAWAVYHRRVEGDHEAALRRARAVAEQLEEIEVAPAVAINAVVHLTGMLVRMGRLDEADAELRRVLGGIGHVDVLSPARKLIIVRGIVRWLQGNVDAAARDLELAPPGPAFVEVPQLLEFHVRASIDRGAPDAALSQLRAFAAQERRQGQRDPTVVAHAGLELYRGRFSSASTFPPAREVPTIDWELELLAASGAVVAGHEEDALAAMAIVQRKSREHDPHGVRLLAIDAAEVAVMLGDTELCTRLLEPVRGGPSRHLRVRGHLLVARAWLAAGRDELAHQPLVSAAQELAEYEQPWVLGEIELELLEAVRLARRGDTLAAQRRATRAIGRRGKRQSLALARAASLLIGSGDSQLGRLAESWVRMLGHDVGADPEFVDWLVVTRPPTAE